MEKEYLLKKWLDNDLNSEELIAFKALGNYDWLIKTSNHLSNIAIPSINTETELESLKKAIHLKKEKQSKNWLNPLLKIAAVFLICFSVYQFTSNPVSEFTTLASQKEEIKLPDNSVVNLNALSSLTFNDKKWDTNRNVSLNGEAFFKVAKGATFNVTTNQGVVTVYGTEFNIKSRDNYFEVICYEGLVGVTRNGNEVKLKPGNSFLVINDRVVNLNKSNTDYPYWLDNESVFNSIPYREVIAEFERQHNLTIITKNIDLDTLFTGGFSHKNLETSLKSITIPLQLSYKKEGNTITIQRD